MFEYRLFVNIFRVQTQASIDRHAAAPPQAADDGADTDSGDTPDPSWTTRVRRGVMPSFVEMPRTTSACEWWIALTAVVLCMTFVLFLVSIMTPMLLALCLIPVLFSFWVPQIVHNYRRKTTSGLSASYVVAMTLSRIFVPLCSCSAGGLH